MSAQWFPMGGGGAGGGVGAGHGSVRMWEENTGRDVSAGLNYNLTTEF